MPEAGEAGVGCDHSPWLHKNPFPSLRPALLQKHVPDTAQPTRVPGKKASEADPRKGPGRKTEGHRDSLSDSHQTLACHFFLLSW